MGYHITVTLSGNTQTLIVVGGRVAVSVTDNGENLFEEYLDQRWLQRGVPHEDRVRLFEAWLSELPEAPPLKVERPSYGQPVILRMAETASTRREQEMIAFIVGPLSPLPPPPPSPASIYGLLPFGTMTDSSTLLYRWEAFPSSRRILRSGTGGTIARHTYAAPSSETPFAPTGFAAIARFALPNLLPACFRWELQPNPTMIECGASVPLYGQSGGGVEVRFPKSTNNRCPIADPVALPVM